MRVFRALVAIALLGFADAATPPGHKPAATPPRQKPAARQGTPRFVGTNECAPEFGAGNLPGKYNTDYRWLDLSAIDHFVAKGFNTFRVNTMMERMVSTKNMAGPLDAVYMRGLTRDIDHITFKGAYAVVSPHNFGRFYGQVITDPVAFKAFWTKVAGVYAKNRRVIFDTNNEYHDMPGALVAKLNQAAIDGIRAAGATSQYIWVEGNAYNGAWTWTTQKGTDGLTNADTMGPLNDPQGKVIYAMHQYLDSDGSGTGDTCVSGTIGSERLAAATAWLRKNRKMGVLGEFAGGVNAGCEAAIKDLLAYLNRNRDVWAGGIWWADGPWLKDYQFSIQPVGGVAYKSYVPLLLGLK